MAHSKLVIVGAGIAGLCTAVYARLCGYDVELIEQQGSAGGLAASWRREGYVFETCLHWLTGTDPRGILHARWREVFDIDGLTLVHPEEFVRVEDERGDRLVIYSDVERLEEELLRRAPEDASEIRRLVAAIRRFSHFPIPDPGDHGLRRVFALVRIAPYLADLRFWSGISAADYGERFRNPLLRRFFGRDELAKMSMIALIFALAWMNGRDGAYVIGGSQAIIGRIRDRLDRLGGRLRLGARVERILVEDGAAVGVRLSGGEVIRADWVVSAADAHATIYDMLGGRHVDGAIERSFARRETFPSYLQVSLGVAMDLSAQGGHVTRILDTPLRVDPETELSQLSVRFFHFDHSFAPPGKTAVTCFLPTANHAYWSDLRRYDPDRYDEEKRQIADAVLAILERMAPGLRAAVDVVDVATPATVIRRTGNWKGSMEGWLPTPGTGLAPLRDRLPGLKRFLMAGQWVMPGGGLPGGLLTARLAVREMCREDGVAFLRESAGRAGQRGRAGPAAAS